MSAGVVAASYVAGGPVFPADYTYANVFESSQFSSFGVAQAFDKDDTNLWSALGSGTEWVTVQCSAAQIFTTMYMNSGNAKNFTVSGSNDNSTWTTLATVTGAANGKTKTTFANSTAYLYYRVTFTSTNGGGAPQANTIAFDDFTLTASADSSSPGNDSFKALDYSAASGWATTTSPPHWNRVLLFETTVVTKYAVTGNPTAWTFEGSNDGTSFTTLDTQTGQSVATENTYSFANATTYLYYRLNVSTCSGGGGVSLSRLRMLT